MLRFNIISVSLWYGHNVTFYKQDKNWILHSWSVSKWILLFLANKVIGFHQRITVVHLIMHVLILPNQFQEECKHVNQPRLVTCLEPGSNHCGKTIGSAMWPLGPWECSQIFPGSVCLPWLWLSDRSMMGNAVSFFFSERAHGREGGNINPIALWSDPVPECHFIFLF